jgi:hypothetical protein
MLHDVHALGQYLLSHLFDFFVLFSLRHVYNFKMGRLRDATGYHRVNCQRAGTLGPYNQMVFDTLLCLANENRRLGLSVVDMDAILRRQWYSHSGVIF